MRHRALNLVAGELPGEDERIRARPAVSAVIKTGARRSREPCTTASRNRKLAPIRLASRRRRPEPAYFSSTGLQVLSGSKSSIFTNSSSDFGPRSFS